MRTRHSLRLGCAMAILLLVAARGSAHAEPGAERPLEFRLELDPRLGIAAGTIAFTTAARLALHGGDWLRRRAEPRLTPATSLLARIAVGVTVDTPIAIAGVVLPHEIFGHGGRGRDSGFDVEYELTPPPPYGWLFGGEVGNSAMWQLDDQATPMLDEQALYSLGGLEVQNLQQHDLAFTAFRARRLTRGDALLYLTASLEVTAYTARSRGDIDYFYAHLENRYLANRSSERWRTRASGAVAAADPLFLASLYAYFYRYLVRGDRAIGYPTIDVGGIDLSFTEGLRLVPWGREHELTIMGGVPVANAASTFAVGEGPGGTSFAWTLRAADIPLGRSVFTSWRGHVARQPRLSVIDRDEPPPTGPLGRPPSPRRTTLALDAGLEYRQGPWALGGHLGWKTDGYVPGASYFAGWSGALTLATRL